MYLKNKRSHLLVRSRESFRGHSHLQDGDEAEEAAGLLEGILQRLPNRAEERIVSLPVPPAFLSQIQSDPRAPHLCWLSQGALTVSQLRQVGTSR